MRHLGEAPRIVGQRNVVRRQCPAVPRQAPWPTDQRRGAAMPGNGEEAARAVARCPRGFQHRRLDAERQHPRHAGRVPLRLRPRRADAHGRPFAGSAAGRNPARRRAQRRRRRKALPAGSRHRGIRHARRRRDRHAPDAGAGAGGRRCAHASARQPGRGFPRSGHRAGRRHAGARRPDLPRIAALHGDGRRHRSPVIARHHGTQSRVRSPERDRRARRRPRREPFRQEHADPGASTRRQATGRPGGDEIKAATDAPRRFASQRVRTGSARPRVTRAGSTAPGRRDRRP